MRRHISARAARRPSITAPLLACFVVLGLHATASTASAAPDNVVTIEKPGGGVTVTQGAEDFLRDYNASDDQRFRNGGRISEPPPNWPTDPAVKEAAKKDGIKLAKRLGGTVAKGALRLVPWVGWGLVVYEVCDATGVCKRFKREAIPPPVLKGLWVIPTPQCGLTGVLPNGEAFDCFYSITYAGTNFPVGVGTNGCTDWGNPPYIHVTPAYTYEGNPDAKCTDAGGKEQRFYPTRTYQYGTFAGPDALADDADGPADVTVNQPELYDQADWDEMAEWLDRPENATVRQHIAAEIDEDVPDPYTDGVRIPRPTTSEDYDQYVERLQSLGLRGRLRFANQYRPAPTGTRPGSVIRVDPEPGSRTRPGTEVVVDVMPRTGGVTDPDAGPGEGTGTGNTTELNTPPVSDAPPTQCTAAPPAPDFGPVMLPLGDKWPFGFPVWIGRILGDLSVTGTAPVVEMPEVAGASWTLDLSDWDGAAAIARTAIGWAGSLFIIAWITGLALNRRVTSQED